MISAAEWADLLERVRWKRPKARIRGRSYRRILEIEATDGMPARLEIASWDGEEDSTFPAVRVEGRTGMEGALQIGGVMPFLVVWKKWLPVPGLDRPLEGQCTHPESAQRVMTPGVTSLLKTWFLKGSPHPGILIDPQSVAVCDYRLPVGAGLLVELLNRGIALARLLRARRP